MDDLVGFMGGVKLLALCLSKRASTTGSSKGLDPSGGAHYAKVDLGEETLDLGITVSLL